MLRFIYQKLWRSSEKFIFFVLFVVFLSLGLLIPKTEVLAVDALFNGKFINGSTDDYLLWLQTYDEETSPYYFDHFYIDKLGKVGIGTTVPTAKLEVNGTSIFSGLATFTQPVIVGTPFLAGHAVTKSYFESALNTASGGGVGSGISGQTLRHDGTSWVANSNLYNNGTNVGVGTTTPADRLQVYGNTFLGKISGYPFKSLWSWDSDNTGYYSGIGYQKNDGTNQKLFAWWKDSVLETNINSVLNVATITNTFNGSAPNTGRTIGVSISATGNSYFNGGNVGIGTTAPDNLLTVSKDQDAITRIQIENPNTGTSAGTNLLFTKNGVSQAGNYFKNSDLSYKIATYVAGDIFFSTTNIERMRILADGNVGIGTTTPTSKLSVSGGNIFVNDAVITSITPKAVITKEYLDSSLTAFNTENNLWKLNGTNLYASSTSWNIGIGTTAPNAKLEIAGDLKIGNTTATCDSTKTGTFKYDSVSAQSYLCDGTRWINQNNCGLMTDDDGNTYGTVQIGGQCWMAENINVGTMLASGATEPNTGDQVIEKWCYNNDSNNCDTYGGLYNWNEVMRGSEVAGAQGICPTGWHVPTDAEYNQLEKTVVGVIDSPNSQYDCDLSYSDWQRCADNTGTDPGANGVGQALKQVGVGSSVGAGNDLVGFSGTLAGYRSTNASFYTLGSALFLWSSTPSGASTAWRRLLYTSYSTVRRNAFSRAYGFSVRCLRD